MGTCVCTYTSHNLPTHSGEVLLRELERRLGANIHLRTEANFRDEEPPGRWHLTLYHLDVEWVADADVLWRLRQEFELHYHRGNNQYDRLSIYPRLAEVDISCWGEWDWVLNDLMNGEKNRWTHCRQQVRHWVRQAGGKQAVYLSDKVSDGVVFVDEPSDVSGTYISFAELIPVGLNKNFPLWDVSRLASLGVISPENYSWETMLLDDFSDL